MISVLIQFMIVQAAVVFSFWLGWGTGGRYKSQRAVEKIAREVADRLGIDR